MEASRLYWRYNPAKSTAQAESKEASKSKDGSNVKEAFSSKEAFNPKKAPHSEKELQAPAAETNDEISSDTPGLSVSDPKRIINCHGLERRRNNSSHSSSSRGVSVLFCWMNSTPRNLEPYVRLVHSLGFHALLCHPPLVNLWLPSQAKRVAAQVMAMVSEHLTNSPQPLLLWFFSGGFKAAGCHLMEMMLQPTNNILKQCLAGLIFDSCPLDFVPSLGVRFLSQLPGTNRRSTLRAAAASAVAWLLTSFQQAEWGKQRRWQGQVLRPSLLYAPLLFLYSANDDLAPAGFIDQLMEQVSKEGGQAWGMKWQHSSHVAHLRDHTRDYSAALLAFAEICRYQFESAAFDPEGSCNSASPANCNSNVEGSQQKPAEVLKLMRSRVAFLSAAARARGDSSETKEDSQLLQSRSCLMPTSTKGQAPLKLHSRL